MASIQYLIELAVTTQPELASSRTESAFLGTAKSGSRLPRAACCTYKFFGLVE